MISKSFISQLVSQCDIEDIMSSYIVIKKVGRNSKAVCPFHSEKTPSFVVYPDSQSFYCFGCGAGGDIISFVMRAENLEYVEAVRFLAKRVGVQVPDDGDDEASLIKSKILQINKETAKFFHQCLKQPFGKDAYNYFKDRGLSDQIITSYGLGFAPNSWDSLYKHLKAKGFSDYEMYSAAVVAKGKSNHYYDQFRNRVIFPIIDLRGNVIAFGGRVLDDSKPKYLNSADTPVFKKSRNLFSLNFAKSATTDKLILAEGYMDVIAIYAAGFKNVVATLGTALTEEQARLMSKYAKEIVIAYDSDGPGQAATMRAINLLSDAGMATKVLHMEGAKDPDEYIKKFGVKRFEILIDGASNAIEHELNALKLKCDMDTVGGKIDYIKRAINILAEVKNPLEREVYGSIVADISGTTNDTVKAQTEALIKKKYAAKEKRAWRDIELNKEMAKDRINPQKIQNIKEAVAEEGIIAFLFKNPDFYEYLQSKLSIEDFVTDFNKRVLESMIEINKENGDVTISSLVPLFSQEQINSICAIVAKNNDKPNTKDMLDDYIDILIEHKDKIKPHEVKLTDPSEIEKYRQKLKLQK